MGPEPGEDHEKLIAERDAILRQLQELGDSGDDEDESEDDEIPENVEEFEGKFEVLSDEERRVTKNVDEDFSPKNLEKRAEPTEVFEDNDTSIDSSTLVCGKTPPGLDDDGELSDSQDRKSSGASCGNSVSSPLLIEKNVLDRIDNDKNNPLPDGWIVITLNSGMMVYYHKFTRVVTHSRPYQVEGLIRDHEIPVSAIPCLYRQIMDEKHKELEERASKCPMSLEEKRTLLELPPEKRLLTQDQHREYCEKRFKFKKMTVTRFTNSIEKEGAIQQKRVNSLLKKRGFDMDYDQLKKRNNPGEVLLSSTSGAVLIDLTPVQANPNNRKSGSKKPYLLNPMGKTSVAVLNEFVQRLAKGNLVYETEDTRNVSAPYKAIAMLTMKMSIIHELAGQCKESLIVLSEIAAASDDRITPSAGVPPDCKRFEIGSGVGPNKKTARLVAAKNAMLKLVPKLRINEEYICDGVLEVGQQKGFEEESRELFKQVKIDSLNLVQMCTRFAIPKPYSLLRDAVSRSLRWHGMELVMKKEMVGNGSQLSKVVLGLGDMEAEAESIGVKQATQLASQLLFKKMHPELQTYGSFLEVYGRLNDKSKIDNARRQHDQVVRLRDTGNLLGPNYIVLNKLAEEMSSVCLHYPPKKFLYGLAPLATGIKTDKKSVPTQTDMEDHMPIMNMHPMHVVPQYYHGAIVPIMHPQYTPAHPLPHEYPGYQPQPFYQNISRKRGRTDDDLPEDTFSPRPPY